MFSRLMEVGGHGVSVRRLGASRCGEIRITRFLRNRRVTVADMVVEASRRTAQRVSGRHLLAIQDTTVLQSKGGGGHYLHAMIGVDADDDAILGLVYGSVLSRTKGGKATRHERSIEKKESYRWLEGAKAAAEVGQSASQITVIADRESDIYDLFVQRPVGVDLLIRAAHNRAVEDGESLFATVDGWPEKGRTQLDLPPRPGSKARSLTLAVRYGAVPLKRPKGHPNKALAPSLTLNIVDVQELDPMPGQQAVHWRLLTTHKVDNVMDALSVVGLYRRRWAIEQLFRTFKTQGFDIEGVRIADETARSNLAVAALIAAVSVQQLVHARDGAPANAPLRPLTDTFYASDLPLLKALTRKLEGKTERQKNPHPEGSLAHASWVCARLGGWTGYYGKPGPAVMLHGWLRFQDAKMGASIDV